MKQLSYVYNATVHIEMNFAEFDCLYLAAQQHYDGRVRESTTHGHFMFGFKNRRTWAEEDGKDVFDAEWNSSQINLMTKALEMQMRVEKQAYDLYQDLSKEFHKLQNEIKILNNW